VGTASKFSCFLDFDVRLSPPVASVTVNFAKLSVTLVVAGEGLEDVSVTLVVAGGGLEDVSVTLVVAGGGLEDVSVTLVVAGGGLEEDA